MIREIVLRHYLTGEAECADLVAMITSQQESPFHYQFMDMDTVHVLSRQDLLRLCESVQNEDLDPALLQTIGEWLVRSEQFEWPDDEVMNEVCCSWMEPEEDMPPTREMIKQWIEWLKK